MESIAQALLRHHGNIAAAARSLGASRTTIYARLKEHSELVAARLEGEESLKDKAEAQLVKLIEEGNLGAICFFLKCKGKDRGYVERLEQDVRSQVNVSHNQVQVYVPDNDRRIIEAEQPTRIEEQGQDD